MYLHLGQNTVIRAEDVIGVFDLDTATVQKKTRDFLNRAEKEGKIRLVSDELPKSFIVCKEKDKQVIYLSQISTATLKKRVQNYDRSIGLNG